MAERYEGVVGQAIDLYLYVRNPNGTYVDPYSTGQVLIYPNDPVTDWQHNVVASSPFGVVPTSASMNTFSCSGVDFLNVGVEVGNYLEIESGPNAGLYKITVVYRHLLELEIAFVAADTNINFEITLLKTILYPQRISSGTYKVIWNIPVAESGGYYYDWWLDIQDTNLSASYDKVMSMYASHDMPYYLADNSDNVADRYTARVGANAFLKMEFRDYNSGAPRDPYSIQSIDLFFGNPSMGSGTAITSVYGMGDATNLYRLEDQSVIFTAISPSITRYHTVEITAPAPLVGFYRLDYVESAHVLRLMDILPGFYIGISYNIRYMYHLDPNRIAKVKTGEYGISVPIPDDFVVGKYWDMWSYIPDASRLVQHVTYDFEEWGDYTLNDGSLIVVDNGGDGYLELVDAGGGNFSFLKPYATKTIPTVLTDPSYLYSITESFGIIHDGSVEYSMIINGNDLFFNGVEWVLNSGDIQLGDQLWAGAIAVWHMGANWEDSKGANDATRHGTGTAFGGGSPFNSGIYAQFNGVDDYLVVPTNTSFMLDVYDFSFAIAFKTAGHVVPADQVLVMQAYGSDVLGAPGWILDMLSTGELRFRAGTGSAGSAFNISMQTAGSYADNLWHTVAIGIANHTTIGMSCIIIDGVQIITTTGLNDTPLGTNYPVMVGADFNKGGVVQKFFIGGLQELALFRNTFVNVDDARRLTADWVNDKHSNVKSVMISQFGLLPVVHGDNLGFNVYLISDGTTQIQMDEVSIDWYQDNAGALSVAIGEVNIHDRLYSDVPGPMDMCMVQGRLVRPDNSPSVSETIVAYGFDTPQIANGAMVSPNSVEVKTDIGGYFNLLLPQGIKVWLSVPMFGYRKKVTIPNLTKVNWINLTAEEEGGL